MPPGSRNKVAAVAAKRGHYDDIPDHGLEARWVEDAAAAQPDSEEEAGEERKNRDTLEDQAEAPGTEPRPIPSPASPFARERDTRFLTHQPYKVCCEKCVEGKGAEKSALTAGTSGGPRGPSFDYGLPVRRQRSA